MSVHGALLHRDDRVIRDLDVLRTDLGAALGDVAEPEPLVLDRVLLAIGVRVQRMHVQFGGPDEEARPGERRLVLLVVADHVAGVLAEEALDALAELLRALHVDLLHPVLAGLEVGRGSEGRHLARLGVVEGHVGHQVADHREGTQWGDRDGLVLLVHRHAGHATEAGLAVDLHRAGAALAGLAVPPHREVRRLGGLEPVDDVEDDLALVHLDLEVLQLAAGGVAAPDPEIAYRAHHSPSLAGWYDASSSSVMYFFSSDSSKSPSSSARSVGTGLRASATSPVGVAEQTRLTWRHSGSICGKSSRVCPPRDSSRSSAARAVHSETSTMLRRSSARCQPGLNRRPPGADTFGIRSLRSLISLSDSSSSDLRRMIPTRSCMTCWRSCQTSYGFSPPSRVSGASAVSTAASTESAGTAGRSASRSTYKAAYSPARLPNTSRSDSEVPPSRLDPCTPPETPPAANTALTGL